MMKIECRACGAQYDYQPEPGKSVLCACGSSNVHVVDLSSVLRIKAARAGLEAKEAIRRAAEPIANLARFRHNLGGWPGGPQEAMEGPCPRCGRADMNGASTFGGTTICQSCARKFMGRSQVDNRPRDERWGESVPLSARPVPKREPEAASEPGPVKHREEDRVNRSSRRQRTLAKIRMNELRRESDGLRVPR